MNIISKNIQVINAIICAVLMIGFSLLSKPEDSNTFLMTLGAIAAVQVVISFFLVNKDFSKMKRA